MSTTLTLSHRPRPAVAHAVSVAVSAIGILLASLPVAGASPTSGASVAPPPGPVVVTMEVVDETFRVLLTRPEDVATAWALLAGEAAPSIPNGRIVYGDGGVNAPWHWQLDPDDFEWADMTTEVCDGRPSDVEAHLVTSDRYCPWLAPVIAVDAATPVPSAAPSGDPTPSVGPLAPLRTFLATMRPAWARLDGLRPTISDPGAAGVERIGLEGRAIADALKTGLRSALPDVCYLDAWRLQWLVVVDLRLVADLWASGRPLYAGYAVDRLAADLDAADEALATIGCD